MKTLGLLMLLAVSAAAGIYGAFLAGRELAQTSALLEFLRYLWAGVEKDLPLEALLIRYGDTARSRPFGPRPGEHPLERCGFLSRLRGGERLCDALRCCDAIGKTTAALFSDVCLALETGRGEELKRRFPLWEQSLAKTEEGLSSSLKNKQKVSITLGLLTGLLLIILLW